MTAKSSIDTDTIREALGLHAQRTSGHDKLVADRALASLARLEAALAFAKSGHHDLAELVVSLTERSRLLVEALREIDKPIVWPAGMPAGDYWKHVASKRREIAIAALADVAPSETPNEEQT